LFSGRTRGKTNPEVSETNAGDFLI
jgi:hypothetical protein